jgi:hypothetical protein
MPWELQLCRSQPSLLLQAQELAVANGKKRECFMSDITGRIQRLE